MHTKLANKKCFECFLDPGCRLHPYPPLGPLKEGLKGRHKCKNLDSSGTIFRLPVVSLIFRENDERTVF